MAFDFKNTTLATTDDTTFTVAVADSDSFNVHRFVIESAAQCTVKIQWSPDGGTNWFDLKESVNAAASAKAETLELDRPWQKLRVNCTANTTAKVTVFLTQLYDQDAETQV